MALVFKDRVRETSTTTGTGTLTLAGALTGFQTFSSAIGNTNTTYYTIINGAEFEVGLGTVSAGALSRDTVLESSNAGSLVSLSAGVKDVFCTYPAEKAVTTDVIGTIASQNANNVSITGGSIAVTADPTTSLQVATKQYVDALISGLHVHDAVSAATTAALSGTVTYNNGTSGVGATLTLGTALTVLDGYTLVNGDRVLVKNQANAAHNGVYTWATGGTVLTRATDADTTTELNGGDFFFVVHGTINGDTGWVITATVTTIGTSDVTFTQFSGAGTYTAGTGLTLTGSQFSIDSTVTTLTGSQTLTNKSLTSPTVTGQATFAAGTVADPAITTTGDTNTGIFFPAADTIAFAEGGAEAMRIDSSGNVGIGTSSPAYKLHALENIVGNVWIGSQNTNAGGNAGFIAYNSAAANQPYCALSQQPTFAILQASTANNPMTIYTAGSERMRIHASGGVSIGNTTDPSAGNLSVTGKISDSKGDVRAAPINSKTAAYVLVAGDAGQTISITTGGVTVNASVLSAGDMVSIFNNSGSSQTITQGTSVTLRLTGTATTGNRTLAQYGVATLLCVIGGATPTFACTGSGLT